MSLVKQDCFAYVPAKTTVRDRHSEEHCEILTDVYCRCGECSWYKASNQVDKKEIKKSIGNYKKARTHHVVEWDEEGDE